MKRTLLLLLGAFVSLCAVAQTGEIQGKVTDADNGEGLPFATVTVEVSGNLMGAQTDFDGYYSIKPVPAGSYSVVAKYLGYQTSQTNEVLVQTDKITFLDLGLSEESQVLDEIVIKEYKVPLIKPDETSTGGTVTKEDINNLPTRNVSSIASTTAGVYQEDEGADLNVKGSRSEATDYYIDGIKVRGSTAIPASAIEQMNVVTGGVPARYGDATGGIINITTRGPSSQFSGGLEAITSEFLDPYGYNLFTGSLSGPILSTRGEVKRPLVGFFVAGEYLLQGDDDPNHLGITKIKDDVREDLIANPLRRSENSTGLLQAIEFLEEDDFEVVDAKLNREREEINIAGKIDIQPVKNINISIGGNFHDRQGGTTGQTGPFTDFMRRYNAFDWEHTPEYSEFAYRGFVRFTQRFGTKEYNADASEEDLKTSALQNAFYSLQFDYTKSGSKYQDPIFQDRLFDYGFVGKFTQDRELQYAQSDIEVFNSDGSPITINAREFQGFANSGVSYEPGDVSPEAVAYNNQFFDLIGDDLADGIDLIQGQEGLINGARFLTAYNLYYSPGQYYNNYFLRDRDQYRLTFNGSVDVKRPGASDRSKHALEFGIEYEQRIERQYDVERPDELWNRMRQLTSVIGPAGEIQRDLDNPFVLVNGQMVSLFDYDSNQYGPIGAYDTITYNLTRVAEGSYFDSQFRSKFGFGNLDFINSDAYGPDDYTLDMFSPDDLFGGGNRDNIVRYYGFDHLGNKLDRQPSFNDFWTARDEETGYLSRPMGAFQPIYTSAFIQDKFSFKDIIFRVGVRVDRFDANQKVLKDQFSLYGVRSAGEVNQINGINVNHPETIGEDYVVYVNDEVNPSEIKGYRDGLDWYDANGSLVVNPSVLAASGNVLPYLSNPLSSNPQNDVKSENFDPDTAFEDYEPQISVMPRISFSFPISDEALFFAHYDVLTQRPQGRGVGTAHDYYFFAERAVDNVFQNPNLKPEKTVDYQFGFQQKLSRSSALKLASFYREMRDMVQIINIPFAYPNTYNTYGNVDFGTVKGFEATYDLRRTNNLRMLISYTLQFADGTGSGDRSALNLVNAGQPNIRAIQSLDFDARHMMNANLDYRFSSGKKYDGPSIGGLDILSDFGVNATIRARSGTPYSQDQTATPRAQFGVATRTSLEGQVNGSRLPWSFDLDLRADKSFYVGADDNLRLNVYIAFQNLLNTLNVVDVYRFTGSPVDDGYLASGVGTEDADNRANPDSFRYLYTAKANDPNHYAQPRTTRLGVQVSF